jgi:hypothetical protein
MNFVYRVVLPLSGLLALTTLVYWPGLNGPLILDDVANLDILRLLSEQDRLTLANVLAERGGVVGGRPVSWASFLLNWRLSGADVWSFKLVNLLIHLVNGCLVLLLAHILLPVPEGTTTFAREWLALAVCGFWLLTPLQVSSVLYLVQRMTLLSAFFCLAGLTAYCVARHRLAERPRAGLALMAIAVLACWPLATLSKQNGALLVPLLLAVEFLVFSPRDSVRWPLYSLAVLCGLLVSAGAARVLLDPQWVLDSYLLRDFTLEQRLLSQPRILLDYLLNILQLPGGSALGLFHDDFPVSTSLGQPITTIPAILFWVAVVVLAWLWRGRKSGLVLAGLVFFLVGHSLEAGPFGLEMYFEHRNYLPSLGLWLASMTAVAFLLQRVPRQRLLALALLIFFSGHIAFTLARADAWRSFEGIVTANAETHPDSRRARAGGAIVAFTAGELDQGLEHLSAVRSIGGPSVELPVALKSFVGYCLAKREPGTQLVKNFQSTRQLIANQYTLAALRWYRTVSASRDCPGLDTTAVSRKLVELVERGRDARDFGLDWLLHHELSQILETTGQHTAARRFLRRALSTAPRSRSPEMKARLLVLEQR